jgi:hypothetical protein
MLNERIRSQRPTLKFLPHILLATLALLAVPTAVPAQECPGFDSSATASTRLEHDDIDESSGLAASRRHKGMFWTHNDSGDDPRLFMVDGEGKHIGELKLGDVPFVDVEDMAVAPCEPGADESCIYVGDIGDNRAKRPQVLIYKLREPELPQDRPFSIEAKALERIVLQYDEGPRNAETLMVHPTTLDLFIVGKNTTGTSGVWTTTASTVAQPKSRVLERTTTVQTPSPIQLGRYITAGDISPNGSRISLRTYLAVFTWCVAEDQTVVEALEADPTVSSTPGMVQAEALAYDLDGESIWLTSERRPTPLIRLRELSLGE